MTYWRTFWVIEAVAMSWNAYIRFVMIRRSSLIGDEARALGDRAFAAGTAREYAIARQLYDQSFLVYDECFAAHAQTRRQLRLNLVLLIAAAAMVLVELMVALV